MPQGIGTPIEWDASGKPTKWTAGAAKPAPLTVREWDANGKPIESATVSQTPRSTGQQLFDTGFNTLDQAAHAVVSPVVHPLDTGAAIINAPKDLAKSHMDQAQKAYDAFQRGDRGEATLRALASIVPVVGPMLANYADADQSGKEQIAGGVIGGLASGRALQNPTRLPVTPGMANPNSIQAAAAEFAQSRGIPMDAASMTGNRAVRSVQHMVDRSIGGGFISENAAAKQAEGLTRTGKELAEQVSPGNAMSPYQAGESMRKGVESRIAEFSQKQRATYDAFRNIADDPKSARTVTVTVNGKPSPVKLQMPVNVQDAKVGLKSVYDDLTSEMPIAKQQMSDGLVAIKNILDAPEYMSATKVDSALSALKKLQRETTGRSQILASQAIDGLEAELQKSVTAIGGKPAVDALKAGRSATKQVINATELADMIRKEPVQAFNQAVWKGDSGIDQLKEVARLAPQTMKQAGRAYIDNLLDTATEGGGFDKARTIQTKWAELGPQTKALMFPDAALRTNLDKFFQAAKMMSENANTSGTAHNIANLSHAGLIVVNPMTGVPLAIGQAGLSKLLHSPAGIKALTQGLSIPVGGKTMAALAAYGAIKQSVGPVEKK